MSVDVSDEVSIEAADVDPARSSDGASCEQYAQSGPERGAERGAECVSERRAYATPNDAAIVASHVGTARPAQRDAVRSSVAASVRRSVE